MCKYIFLRYLPLEKYKQATCIHNMPLHLPCVHEPLALIDFGGSNTYMIFSTVHIDISQQRNKLFFIVHINISQQRNKLTAAEEEVQFLKMDVQECQKNERGLRFHKLFNSFYHKFGRVFNFRLGAHRLEQNLKLKFVNFN